MPSPTDPDVLPLACRCGVLRGSFSAEPTGRGRGVCYCDDCQAYARFLGAPDLLDPWGGTDVIQTWPARIQLTAGIEVLTLLRLSPKGLHRWYAACCRSPVANCMDSPRMPFAGLMRAMVKADEPELLRRFGPVRGFQGRFAPGGCPPGAVPSATPTIIFDAMRLLALGWWGNRHSPSPFWDAAGHTRVAARVLSAEERHRLG